MCKTETKALKRLVRDCIDPERGLGHVDGVKATATSKGAEKVEDEGKGVVESTGEETRKREPEGPTTGKGAGGGRGGGGGRDGKDGKDGVDWQDGRDGRNGMVVTGGCADCG